MEKQYTSLRGRLNNLRKRGMDIPKDKSKERNVLKKYNYYNLINGYKTPFLEDKNNYPRHADVNEDFYISGTTPSHLESLYLFDEKLRLIFLERILKIEEKLKDVMVQAFYEYHTNKGKNKLVEILHRESEYLRRDYYNLTKTETYLIHEKSGFKYTILNQSPSSDDTMKRRPSKYLVNRDDTYDSLIAIVYRHIGQQRKKNKSIDAYLNNHTYLPMWILSNILTFGNISKLFEIQDSRVQLLVLQKIGIGSPNLSNDLDTLNTSRVIHILSLFRNLCAHNERFYCTPIRTPIDDEFMGYLTKFVQHSDVIALKGNTRYLSTHKNKKLERHRHGIYTLMYCISLFMNQSELTKFKNEIKKELNLLQISIPTRTYENVIKQMGLDFDWYLYLTK